MIEIVLNGGARAIEPHTSVLALLEASGFSERRVAVEINREIVPRSALAARLLADGDRVEIVHAMGGG